MLTTITIPTITPRRPPSRPRALATPSCSFPSWSGSPLSSPRSLLAPALPLSTAELDPELSFWGIHSAISKELSLAIEAAAGQGRPRGGRIRALRARGKGGVEGWVIRHTHAQRERESARASERARLGLKEEVGWIPGRDEK